jgi:UDP-N-acetylmuramate dehydrogenase
VSAIEELVRAGGARVDQNVDLGPHTTYRVGGRARLFVTIATQTDLEELEPLVRACGLEVLVVGNGSNLLVADGEHDLIGLQLAGDFATLSWRDEGDDVFVDAGAGLDLPVAARRLSAEGIVGFEWAVGVPGTFGGAAVMNAGGHGSNMAASVVRVHTWRGQARVWSLVDLHYGYRSSALGPGELVTTVTLRLARGDAQLSRAQLSEIVRWRREHQPGGANAGSVFQNPPGDSAGRLIDAAGLKGQRVGSAVVSEKHANFILVDVGGSANDVYRLMRLVRDRVLEDSGVELVSEHRLVGFGVDP